MRTIKTAFTLAFAVLLATAGLADVLKWAVAEEASVDGSPDLYTYLAPDTEIGVRAVQYDRNGNLTGCMPLVSEPEFADAFFGSKDDISMMQALQSFTIGEDIAESLFQIQVGYYDDDFAFVSVLYSVAATGASISKFMYEPGDISPPSMDWRPLNFRTVNPVTPSPSVPEPSSGLLALAGLAVLCLRRGRPSKT